MGIEARLEFALFHSYVALMLICLWGGVLFHFEFSVKHFFKEEVCVASAG